MKLRPFSIFMACTLFLMTASASWGAQQADFKILGVSTNLTKLGVSEVWIEEGTGQPHCEVRLYTRNQWEPDFRRILKTESARSDKDTFFQSQCKAFQNQLIEEADLHSIEWVITELTPKPASIKDAEGKLLSTENRIDPYPLDQRYEFALPTDAFPWEILVQSYLPEQPTKTETRKTAESNKMTYTLVVRPKVEPVPYLSIQTPYLLDQKQQLISPLKVLTNNHYGLVMITFRDTRQSEGGLTYYYRPLFMQWPNVIPMTVDEAKNTLRSTTEYAMETNENRIGINTLHPSYRAYMRLKAEKLSLEDIKSNLKQSSLAGQLYWMALLYQQDKKQYHTLAQELFSNTPPSVNILEAQGKNWQPRPLSTVLQEQAFRFQVPL